MSLSFYPSTESSTNGVLSYFARKKKIQKYISTFSSQIQSNYYKENILDISNTSFWASISDAGAYVGLNFERHSFKPYYYKIRQYNGDGYMLKNWSFQGSNDKGETWEEIDAQNSESYCVVGLHPTIQISLTKVKEYSSFRMIQTDMSCKNSHYMRLAGIELFGELRGETVRLKCTRQRCSNRNTNLLIYMLIISR